MHRPRATIVGHAGPTNRGSYPIRTAMIAIFPPRKPPLMCLSSSSDNSSSDNSNSTSGLCFGDIAISILLIGGFALDVSKIDEGVKGTACDLAQRFFRQLGAAFLFRDRNLRIH